MDAIRLLHSKLQRTMCFSVSIVSFGLHINIYCFSLKLQVKDEDGSLVCFADIKQDMLGMLDVLCALFWRRFCTICQPQVQNIIFFPPDSANTQRTSDLHLEKNHLWHVLSSLSAFAWYLCAHTGLQQGNVNMWFPIVGSLGLLWISKNWPTDQPRVLKPDTFSIWYRSLYLSNFFYWA